MSENKIFVGNLAWTVNEADLSEAFNPYGDIVDCTVVMDRHTGRSRGFGFVTFGDKSQAESAIEAMNGKELGGRTLNINLAREREKGGDTGGGARRTGGGGRGGFGGGRGGSNGGGSGRRYD